MAEERRVAGEAGVIETLRPLAAGFPGALDLKDDCAVLSPPPGCDLVLKTDAVAEGIHFLSTDDPADIGWKALAVNVSDLAAKGAAPIAYLMSLSFPQMPREAWLAAFAAGLGEAQRAFGIHLAGGDTDKRPGPITITIAAFGAVPTGRMPKRFAAEAGDVLVVSGTLGDAALGLKLAHDPSLAATWGLSEDEAAHLLSRYRRPQPRLGLRAALLGHARASMDLSDGLMKDLGRMAKASGVAGAVHADRLPLSAAAWKALATDPALIACALGGGDDYEVLTAVAPERLDAYRAAAAAGGVEVTEIGSFSHGTGVRALDTAGREIVIGRDGWDHFGVKGPTVVTGFPTTPGGTLTCKSETGPSGPPRAS